MNKLLIIIYIIEIFICKNQNFESSELNNINEIFFIKSVFKNFYFAINKNEFMLSKRLNTVKIIKIEPFTYIISFNQYKRIGIDKNNNIIIYNSHSIINIQKLYWNFIKINKNQYLIKNKYNKKYLMIYKNGIKFIDKINIYFKNITNKYLFNIIKIFEYGDLYNKKHNKIIEKEPIDVLIKYIDLNDKNLDRKGIKHFYKDYDNEELRYCIRSILQYIPWIRKIFILMPNKKVKYFKSPNKIKEKIIYIKDKDLLGFDSANIYAFTFNLYKIEKFGISKNFIYMEDDFFIGKSLNKEDFFYYDEKQQKVFPYILTTYFYETNRNIILKEYNKLFKIKNTFNPHSAKGWKLSILSTNKYFMEKYNLTSFIGTLYTHTAMAENIDDLKEIFKEILNYKYINQTLYSKERNILTLNQPHFLNLYQLNIKHKKVHSIPYNIIDMEKCNNSNLYKPLFVINTCGNNIPSKQEYKIQKYIMEKRFPFPTKYEKIYDIKKFSNYSKFFFLILIVLIKINKNKVFI